MTHLARLEGIRSLLKNHPKIFKSKVADVKYAERFVDAAGMPIVLEPRGQKHTNIWVRADSIEVTKLTDIEAKFWPDASNGESKPNHPLYTDPMLKNVDLICFKVRTIGEAEQVIMALAGTGAKR